MTVDIFHNLVDLVAFSFVIWPQWRIGSSLVKASRNRAPWIRRFILLGVFIIWSWVAVGFALNFHSVHRIVHPSPWLRGVLSGGAYLWAFSGGCAYIVYRAWRLITDTVEVNPSRRKLMNAAGGALVAAPFAVTGFGGLIQRTDFRVREVDIPIPNLPRDLHGLRVLHLSDIHLGPFLAERDLARVIDESQNLRAHLAVITGDLISMAGDPLDACLRQISRLRPEAGILGCMGNHEAYARAQRYTAEQGARLGIDFLRDRARPLRFGTATLNFAGVDYQSVARREAYLHHAERLIEPGAINVLLSHNPDVFPVAAGKGFDVTISGHTHGGQVSVEILNQTLNVARFFTPFVYGRYSLSQPSKPAASLYVTRGIGTIGIPIRVGAPPEITLLRLTPA